MQLVLRKCGEFIGRWPIRLWCISTLLFLGLCSGWHKIVGRPLMSEKDDEEIWSVRGGDVEREVQIVKKWHNEDWEMTGHATMILGKGPMLSEDMLTPEVLAAVEPLYSRFFSLKVRTASGREYSTLDLCVRGARPDSPGNATACEAWEASNRTDAGLQAACAPSPLMPCMTQSPQNCFSEHVAHLPESYLELDKVIDKVAEPSLMGRPYATRPSYRNLSAAQIKAEVSKVRGTGARGCEWFTGIWVFGPTSWGGDVQWNSDRTLVTKVPVLRLLLIYDAPPRISFRLSLTKPDHKDLGEIEEALRLHERAWQEEILSFQDTVTNLEVLNVGPSLEDDLRDGVEEIRWGLLISGSVLMTTFVAVSLSSCHRPMESRVNLGQQGLLVVLLALAASGGLVLLLGYEFNPAMLASLPFMAMGLGVDDMFVLIRYFSDLGTDFIVQKSYPEIIGEVLARGGAGATLTSVCNMAAFGSGAMLPVPGMSDFCIGAAIISLLNYLAVLTQFLPLMVLEARRVKRNEPEPFVGTYFCQRRVLRRKAEKGADADTLGCLERLGGWSVTTLKSWYGPLLAQARVSILVCGLACGLGALSCLSVVGNMRIGLDVSEIAVRGTHEQRALEIWEKFEVANAMVCFADLDLAQHQREILELYDAISKSKYAEAYDLPPFLTLFSLHVASIAQTQTQTQDLNTSWTHPLWAPVGTVTSNTSAFYDAYLSWSRMPLDNPAQAFLPGGDAFLNADMAYSNEFRVENGQLRFSFFPFYQTGLRTQGDKLAAIKDVRRIFAESRLPKEKVFPHGVTITYWSVFLELETILYRVFLIDAVVIFAVTLLLLRSLSAAVASTVSCVLIVVQVYGSSLLFCRFNVFVSAGLLAAAGISVEFTSHLVSAFDSQTGPLPERLGTALAHTTAPLVQGAVSTLLSLLPMAFSPLIIVVKYFFAVFALVCAFGLLTGMLFLPAFMALTARVASCASSSPCGLRRQHPRQAPPGATAAPFDCKPTPAQTAGAIQAAQLPLEDTQGKAAAEGAARPSDLSLPPTFLGAVPTAGRTEAKTKRKASPGSSMPWRQSLSWWPLPLCPDLSCFSGGMAKMVDLAD